MSTLVHKPQGAARRVTSAIYAVAALGLMILVSVHSIPWEERAFPGFFVTGNLVTDPSTLDGWSSDRGLVIHPYQIVAIDGEPVDSARAVYQRVAAAPPGTIFGYTMQSSTRVEELRVESTPFDLADYATSFGPYLVNGIFLTLIGIATWMFGPRAPATFGTTVLTLNAGLACLTAVDLYGPGDFFRLHAACETLLPASLLHLTLVFPVVRLGRHRTKVLTLVYLATLAVATFYQLNLYDPQAYSTIRYYCWVAVGFAGACFVGSALESHLTSTSRLVRKRLGIVLLGTVTALAIPLWMILVSGSSGTRQALVAAEFTAFLLPLSLAYAVVKFDLFEIDTTLRRCINLLLLSAAVGVTYALLVVGLGSLLQTGLNYSPAVPVVFSLLMIVIFTPLRDRIERVVDRLYHQTRYDAQKTLERASGALVTTLNLDEIYTLTIDTICEALLIDEASLWLKNELGQFAGVRGRGARHVFRGSLPTNHPLIDRLSKDNRAVSIYDFVDGLSATPAERACQVALRGMHAELVLPLRTRDELAGLIVLGGKKSGRLYTLDDLDFLHTIANQVAVAILNAQSYRKVEDLNVSLERRVTQRTNELAATNQELAHSLRELERAYNDLRRSQEDLGRAEKMAALGRLTAGIAHEVNTPLGASLNSLKVVHEVVEEYASSIGNPEVNEADHRAMANEMREMIGNVFKWTTKAASYIRSIKTHTRNAESLQERSFDAAQLIDDVLLLLSHRLRLSSCTITVDCPPGVGLYGDPTKLGQVVTNLVTNAIDAYEEAKIDNGVIGIQVCPRPGHVEIVVWDRGCGISQENVERIFETFFTTKPSGKGTGLGLAIARDIIIDCFGGRIEVASTPGVGSFFTLWIPRREPTQTKEQEMEPVAAAG